MVGMPPGGGGDLEGAVAAGAVLSRSPFTVAVVFADVPPVPTNRQQHDITMPSLMIFL